MAADDEVVERTQSIGKLLERAVRLWGYGHSGDPPLFLIGFFGRFDGLALGGDGGRFAIALGVALESGCNALGLIHGFIQNEAQRRRHTPRKLTRHERADAARGLLEGLGDFLVFAAIGGVEDVADAAVVADLAARDGDQRQARVGDSRTVGWTR